MVIFHSYVNVYQRVMWQTQGHKPSPSHHKVMGAMFSIPKGRFMALGVPVTINTCARLKPGVRFMVIYPNIGILVLYIYIYIYPWVNYNISLT